MRANGWKFTDKLTLKAWLDAVVANARGVFDGVSFWELTETRLADPQLASLTVATSLLERVESLLPGLGAETSEWLPLLRSRWPCGVVVNSAGRGVVVSRRFGGCFTLHR